VPVAEYNQAPPNFKEITEKEFAQSFLWNWAPAKQERRQISREELRGCGIEHPPNQGMLGVLMFWHADKTGVAMSADWWAGKLRFFKFAVCLHDFTGEKLGNCYYRHTCKKCGYSHTVDSSG
jgi:hypothetical protein